MSSQQDYSIYIPFLLNQQGHDLTQNQWLIQQINDITENSFLLNQQGYGPPQNPWLIQQRNDITENSFLLNQQGYGPPQNQWLIQQINDITENPFLLNQQGYGPPQNQPSKVFEAVPFDKSLIAKTLQDNAISAETAKIPPNVVTAALNQQGEVKYRKRKGEKKEKENVKKRKIKKYNYNIPHLNNIRDNAKNNKKEEHLKKIVEFISNLKLNLLEKVFLTHINYHINDTISSSFDEFIIIPYGEGVPNLDLNVSIKNLPEKNYSIYLLEVKGKCKASRNNKNFEIKIYNGESIEKLVNVNDNGKNDPPSKKLKDFKKVERNKISFKINVNTYIKENGKDNHYEQLFIIKTETDINTFSKFCYRSYREAVNRYEQQLEEISQEENQENNCYIDKSILSGLDDSIRNNYYKIFAEKDDTESFYKFSKDLKYKLKCYKDDKINNYTEYFGPDANLIELNEKMRELMKIKDGSNENIQIEVSTSNALNPNKG